MTPDLKPCNLPEEIYAWRYKDGIRSSVVHIDGRDVKYIRADLVTRPESVTLEDAVPREDTERDMAYTTSSASVTDDALRQALADLENTYEYRDKDGGYEVSVKQILGDVSYEVIKLILKGQSK